jgi:GntR family transcriptional regulator, galactonate operon transcriptional repressor
MSDLNDLSVLPSAAGSSRRRTMLHHEAVTVLGIAIVSGQLPEGVPLPIEAELGKRLGVSRTVVREATKVLASKGLLRSRPKVGTVPLPRVSWDVLDPEVLGWMLDHGPIADVIRDVSEVRLIIEPAAARLAAMRRSDEEAERLRVLTDELLRSADDDERYVVTDLDFHAAILSATKNATLVRLTGAIGAALRASRRLTVHALGGPRSAMAEHEAVAKAIIDGDPGRAHDRMNELITLTQSHVEWVLAHNDPSLPSTKR